MKSTIKISVFLLLMIQCNVFAQWFPLPDSLFDNWGIAWCIDAPNNSNSVMSMILEDTGSRLLNLDYDELSFNDVTPPMLASVERIIDVEMIDNDHIWITTTGYEGRILATADGGNTWSVQFSDSLVTTFVNYIEMFDLNNGIAMADAIDYVNDPAIFLKTTDGGNTWTSMNNNAFGGLSTNNWRGLDFVNSMIGYFTPGGGTKDDKIFKTIDGGVTWNETPFYGEFGNPEVIKFYDENIGLACDLDYYNSGDRGVIYRTIDGGESWEKFTMAADSWGTDIEFIPNNPSIVWLCDYYSLFFSTDTGKTWTMQSAPTDTLMGRDLVFVDEDNGRLLTENGSFNILFTENNGGIVTDIEENKEIEIPTQLKLEQNYPNPFNPSTTISYSIPKVVDANFASTTTVQLKVYDILGNEITTLVNESKLAGEYEVKFDGTNFPSGVYYYQLKVGNYTQTSKMILMK